MHSVVATIMRGVWLEKIARLFVRTEVPEFDADTFVLWEPCTHSHAELLPGFAKYLLDLGFKVAVFATPKRFDEGLFSRINDPRMTSYRLSQRQVRQHFRRHGLGNARGIMITTARKISGSANYEAEVRLFRSHTQDQRVLLVEHDVKAPADAGVLTPDVITLAPVRYGRATTTVVNPYWFGEVRAAAKDGAPTRFITIGALRAKRRNAQLLIDSVEYLDSIGVKNFRVVVIGRGDLRAVPEKLRGYFEIKGRVTFAELYEEMERAHFVLTLLDPENAAHDRYVTTGTSGSFQLIRGFVKPGIIERRFADHHGFDVGSCIAYSGNAAMAQAMRRAVEMGQSEYAQMQQALQNHVELVHRQSVDNLRHLLASDGPGRLPS